MVKYITVVILHKYEKLVYDITPSNNWLLFIKRTAGIMITCQTIPCVILAYVPICWFLRWSDIPEKSVVARLPTWIAWNWAEPRLINGPNDYFITQIKHRSITRLCKCWRVHPTRSTNLAKYLRNNESVLNSLMESSHGSRNIKHCANINIYICMYIYICAFLIRVLLQDVYTTGVSFSIGEALPHHVL